MLQRILVQKLEGQQVQVRRQVTAAHQTRGACQQWQQQLVLLMQGECSCSSAVTSQPACATCACEDNAHAYVMCTVPVLMLLVHVCKFKETGRSKQGFWHLLAPCRDTQQQGKGSGSSSCDWLTVCCTLHTEISVQCKRVACTEWSLRHNVGAARAQRWAGQAPTHADKRSCY